MNAIGEFFSLKSYRNLPQSEIWKLYYRGGRIIIMLKEKRSMHFCLPTMHKSSTNWNVQNNLILEYISEICSTEMWKRLQYPTGVELLLQCGRKRGACIFIPQPYRNLPQTELWKIINIEIHFWNLFNWNVGKICTILKEWKSYWNVEGKEEHGIFPNHKEIFHKLKCGR